MKIRLIDGTEVQRGSGNVYADIALYWRADIASQIGASDHLRNRV